MKTLWPKDVDLHTHTHTHILYISAVIQLPAFKTLIVIVFYLKTRSVSRLV